MEEMPTIVVNFTKLLNSGKDTTLLRLEILLHTLKVNLKPAFPEKLKAEVL